MTVTLSLRFILLSTCIMQMHSCSDLQLLSRMHMSWTLECCEHSVACKDAKVSKGPNKEECRSCLDMFWIACLRLNLFEQIDCQL